MPLTKEQLDNWFTFHPPTDDQRLKYEAIRIAEYRAVAAVCDYHHFPTHDEINAAMRNFAEVIDAHAPDSADKTAAIRCVRIARNAFNDWVVNVNTNGSAMGLSISELRDLGLQELRKARYHACSAIACDGK